MTEMSGHLTVMSATSVVVALVPRSSRHGGLVGARRSPQVGHPETWTVRVAPGQVAESQTACLEIEHGSVLVQVTPAAAVRQVTPYAVRPAFDTM